MEQVPATVGPEARLGWVEAAPRRWPYVALSVILAAALAGVSIALVSTMETGQAWRATAMQRAADLRTMAAQKDDLAAQLKTAQAGLASARSTLADTTARFNAATARIRTLADEKAHVGDQAALLAEAVLLSKQVSSELDTCISDLQQLQGYLVNFQSYDLTWLASYAGEVNRGCDRARSDNAALAQKLGAQ